MSQDNLLVSVCKNCSHPVAFHGSICGAKTSDSNEVCGCSHLQYHNAIVSGNYVGWTEIHCSSCGILIGFIDSTREDIYDYITLCPDCIIKAHHESTTGES